MCVKAKTLTAAEFARLSTSNEPPSSFACEMLRPRYAQTIKTLEILDSQIEKLREERARLKEQSRLYASILHPIRNLPPEILTEIFRICTASHTKELVQDDVEGGDSSPGSLNTRKAPSVDPVDVPWRKLEGQLSNQRLASLEYNLMLQLERSRTQPLTIVYDTGMGPRSTVVGVLPLLLKFHSQWEDVSLKGNVRVFRYLHPYRGRFPKLKTLRLGIMGDEESDVTGAFDDLPSLERLTLVDDVEYLLRSEDQLPWKQVMHYASRESPALLTDVGEQFRILPRLVNIRTCVIESLVDANFDAAVDVPRLEPHLNLRFLHTLVLSQIEDDRAIKLLFDWLILPALRVLRLPQSFDCPRALVDFLDRSSCQLEELVVTDAHSCFLDTLDDFMQVFEVSSLQSLHTLGFGCVQLVSLHVARDASDRIFNALIPAENSPEQTLLPNLQRLILVGPLMEWSEEVLLKMVTARRQCRVTVEGAGIPRRLEELVFVGFADEKKEYLGPGYRTPLKKSGLDKIADLCADGLVFRTISGVDWYEV
ncbi:hypothetical protein AAF712_007403 [Marasmius tenuissimus]|uniref:F-box domain-containing protein n=1 Tax=Marasmius tenuissimus TaxID=585030 RepID=A0ABR2ZVA8_9AGAR